MAQFVKQNIEKLIGFRSFSRELAQVSIIFYLDTWNF